MIFREGTIDADCWRGIVDGNEYRLPDRLDPQALIVDIGTHIGSFVQTAWNRGARNIISYEADLGNFCVARENVGHLAGVTLYNSAVGRSDARAQEFVRFGGYQQFFDGRTNTGGGHVFAEDGPMVCCTRLDDIAPGQPIDLLKIDCEGSEWPILRTSNLWRVRSIVGEYHSLPDLLMMKMGLAPFIAYSGVVGYLRAILAEAGFQSIRIEPPNELHAQMHDGQQIGLFSATR